MTIRVATAPEAAASVGVAIPAASDPSTMKMMKPGKHILVVNDARRCRKRRVRHVVRRGERGIQPAANHDVGGEQYPQKQTGEHPAHQDVSHRDVADAGEHDRKGRGRDQHGQSADSYDGPHAMGVLYPRRLMSGSSTVPSMAVLARVEP